MVEAPTRQRPGSAPVPPQGAPGSLGWLGAPRREVSPVDSQPLPSTSRGRCTVQCRARDRPPACCTYQRRRAAYPGRRTPTSLGRAVRTAYRGAIGDQPSGGWHQEEL